MAVTYKIELVSPSSNYLQVMLRDVVDHLGSCRLTSEKIRATVAIGAIVGAALVL